MRCCYDDWNPYRRFLSTKELCPHLGYIKTVHFHLSERCKKILMSYSIRLLRYSGDKRKYVLEVLKHAWSKFMHWTYCFRALDNVRSSKKLLMVDLLPRCTVILDAELESYVHSPYIRTVCSFSAVTVLVGHK